MFQFSPIFWGYIIYIIHKRYATQFFPSNLSNEKYPPKTPEIVARLSLAHMLTAQQQLKSKQKGVHATIEDK